MKKKNVTEKNDAIEIIENNCLIIIEAKRKAKKGKWLRIFTPYQMLQRLSTAPEQVKSGYNLDNLLNETTQIVYSLYQSEEITKKLYNNIMKWIQT